MSGEKALVHRIYSDEITVKIERPSGHSDFVSLPKDKGMQVILGGKKYALVCTEFGKTVVMSNQGDRPGEDNVRIKVSD